MILTVKLFKTLTYHLSCVNIHRDRLAHMTWEGGAEGVIRPCIVALTLKVMSDRICHGNSFVVCLIIVYDKH